MSNTPDPYGDMLRREFGRRLIDAARGDDIDEVRRLVQQGCFLNEKQADGTSALNWAAFHGHTEIARILIDAGADLEITEDHMDGKYTPLLWAVTRNKYDIASMLLDAGASLAAKLDDGKDALAIARAENLAEMRLLIERYTEKRSHEEASLKTKQDTERGAAILESGQKSREAMGKPFKFNVKPKP